MRLVNRLAVILVSVMITSCATVDPYRPDITTDCQLTVVAVEEASPECRRAAIERTKEFDIGYVEFSDQGWLHERGQLTRTLKLLRESEPRDLQIVVFVHGWKHSARFDDLDVTNFRAEVLPAFARRHPGSRTVGIYVGWRGASLSVPGLLQGITFYDRKSTAEHVARGSVRELISHLRAIRNNQARTVSLTLIGHSFGGLILYNAVAESLLDSLVAANNGDSSSARFAKPIVDLVVLLNPAFEASRFEPLFQVAKEGLSKDASSWRYAESQRPIFVSITSEADGATRAAFPIGRTINSIFDHEGWTDQDDRVNSTYAERVEKVANTNTIGHMARYRTHRLTTRISSDRNDPHTELITCSVMLNKLLGEETLFPLWNMYASADVISGHHDIYGKNLWEFISAIPNHQTSLDPICK